MWLRPLFLCCLGESEPIRLQRQRPPQKGKDRSMFPPSWLLVRRGPPLEARTEAAPQLHRGAPQMHRGLQPGQEGGNIERSCPSGGVFGVSRLASRGLPVIY